MSIIIIIVLIVISSWGFGDRHHHYLFCCCIVIVGDVVVITETIVQSRRRMHLMAQQQMTLPLPALSGKGMSACSGRSSEPARALLSLGTLLQQPWSPRGRLSERPSRAASHQSSPSTSGQPRFEQLCNTDSVGSAEISAVVTILIVWP